MIGTRNEQLGFLKQSYRSFARAAHPDVSPEPDAELIFVKLENLYAEAQSAIHRGRYGRARYAAPLIFRGQNPYRVLEHWEGEGSLLYLAESPQGRAFLKLARNQDGSKSLAREAEIITRLSQDGAVESRLRPYVPLLLESFEHKTSAGERQLNAFRHYQSFVTLSEVRAAYPQGLPWRDAAWIMLRLLVAVGYGHANGFVHAAVLPEHVLIEPDEHGLVLIDWTHAVEPGVAGREQATNLKQQGAADGWYPDEISLSGAPRPASDVYMAGRTMQYLLGADVGRWQLPEAVPQQLRGFLAGLVVAQPGRRPDDAWELKAELDELFGERKFRPLRMPNTGSQPHGGGPAVNDSRQGRSN
jgi:serine/threonine protein kinase